MSKHDFRVQLPLWNIAIFVILMIFTYGAVYAADLLFSDLEGVFETVDGREVINLHVPSILAAFLGFFLVIVFFVAYFTKLISHNREHPNRKQNAFSFLRPIEFLEDDEMFNQVTKNATKNVYTFYSNVMPLIMLFMLFPLDRYLFIMAILLVLIVQNALYYREIRKYIVE
ncbi:hypothetical protein [Bacillus sp. PS06]|uniref:hypothetical protein n=1 Tax=Bacillus sp. PS06 TaxID=2764176 RepID=UPI0017822F9F|nr:hypothetical protein [Bacillus sp. PS06]MBD8069135.1 hypothetical protein [Bacillus sp. PS06]